jgi:hypothetical protein
MEKCEAHAVSIKYVENAPSGKLTAGKSIPKRWIIFWVLKDAFRGYING